MTNPREFNWLFGNGAWLKFDGSTNGPVVIQGQSQMDTREGCSGLSDSNGALIFATDGRFLFDGQGVRFPTSTPPLSGTPSSSHSALVIPPAAGQSLAHVFTVHDWDNGLGGIPYPEAVHHTGISISPSGNASIAPNRPTTALANGSPRSSEHLVAISKADCEGHWLISLDHADEKLFAFDVSSDSFDPDTAQPVTSHYADATPIYCAAAAPDGSRLAFVNGWRNRVDIFDFDASNGQCVLAFAIDTPALPYGVEFSPDSNVLFATCNATGEILHADLSATQVAFTSIVSLPAPQAGSSVGRIGALRLAPNGWIYGAKVSETGLFGIPNPNEADPSLVQVFFTANDAFGVPIDLGPLQEDVLGLPTFARFSDECRLIETDPCDPAGPCEEIAQEVNDELAADVQKIGDELEPCPDNPPQHPQGNCAPSGIPELAPSVHVTWEGRDCGGLPHTGCTRLLITICNPYSDVSFSNLVINRLDLRLPDGTPVPPHEPGVDIMRVIPRGPICFGEIAPCSCVTREIVVETFEAPEEEYRLHYDGLCFDICLHRDAEGCFLFHICD